MKKKITAAILALLLLASCKPKDKVSIQPDAVKTSTEQVISTQKTTEENTKQKEETLKNVDADPENIQEEITDADIQKGEPITEEQRSGINQILNVLRDMKAGTAGASMGHFSAFVELLNNGSVLLENPEETKYIIQEFKNSLEDQEGFFAGMKSIKTFSEQYYADPHSIDDMIRDTGATIQKNIVTQEQMQQIIEILES